MGQKNNYKSVWYFLVLFIVFYGFSIRLYACPAYDGLFELKQPSGKSFEARQHGDEYYNWVETKDGYGIYKNATTGKWEYYTPSVDAKDKGQMVLPITSHAVVGETDPVSLGIPKGLRPPKKELSPDAKLRSLQKKWLDKKLASTSVTGTKYLLVIGVDYADAPATYTAEQIQPLLFGASSSVSHYYSKTSYSAVTINPASESQGTANDGFIGWLRLSGNHPNTGSAGWNSTANKQIAKDAILAADSYIDFSSYDTDGDGIVEPIELSIIIIVAGYEASYGGSSSPSVWAHYSGMSAVGAPTVDSKTIYQYAEFGEKHGDHLSTFGVMAHELGHLMFSLPDLYDTDTSNGDSEGIGYFDLMGTGSWGSAYGAYSGSSPTLLSAWSKEYLSWGTVNSISTSQSVSFPKVDGNSSSIFRINTSDSNQYFLIENRQFAGYDIGFQNYTGASGHGGLAIYHIDKLKTSLWPNTSNNVNADENDKGVDVEEANEGSLGYSMLDTNKSRADTNMFFFSGNNTSFTDSTTPNSKLKNGSSTNISVTDISAYGDTMTATVPARPPIARTGSVTDLTSGSVTLNGTANALGVSTTVWFEYGMDSGSYTNTSSSQSVSGESDTTVSIGISGLSSGTSSGATYYYRIVAQNSAGTTYGSENTFTIITVTPKIAAGYGHTVALKSDGTVWAWGYNSYGQLGDDGTTDSTTPVQVSGLSGVTAIAAGDYHSLVLKSDGNVWAWGYGWDGQLGDGSTTNRTTPVRVSGISSVTAIAAGGYQSLALKSDGTVWAWGYNSYGQLGDGSTTNSTTPVQVSSLSGVTAIAAGDYHSLALKSDGTVWAWGYNGYGQLGDGATTDKRVPVQVSSLSGISAVASGWNHAAALKSDGTVWTWGYNGNGQLGDGTTANKTTPIQVSGLSNVTAVAGGYSFTMFLKSDGTVWSSGAYKWFTKNGERGWYYYRTSAAQFTEISGVSAIAAGSSHYVALKPNGTVWTWGYNYYGQLGDGTTTDNNTPIQVSINLGETATPTPSSTPTPSDTTAPANCSISINSGASSTNSPSVTLDLSATDDRGVTGYHVSESSTKPSASTSGWTSITSTTSYSASVSYTLSSGDGSKTVYVWYKDAAGNVSTASSDSITLATTSSTPTATPTPATTKAPTVTTGSATNVTSSSATLNGTVNANGLSTTAEFVYRTTGSYSSSWRTSKQTVSGSSDTTVRIDISGLSSGTSYSYRIQAENNAGTTYGGENTFTTTTVSATPTPTPTTSITPQIAAGGWHTVALKSDGTVWTWGGNWTGQLGDGSTTKRTTPVQVSGLGGITAIASKGEHTIALKSDGTVWTWGNNGDGQLGDGSTTKRTTPVQISALSSITAISAGYNYSMALKSDGTVWTWGDNQYGQLGDGSTTDRNTPVQVSGLSNVIVIAGGYDHAMALKSDGTVWTWGRNQYGQLGDGTTTQKTAPIQVSELSSVIAIAGGQDHTIALKSDGTVWTWGRNSIGQLGDGTTTDKTTPVQVSTLSGITAIDGGGGHTIALKSDGSVWTCGAYEWEDDGNGWTFWYRLSPKRITGISDVTAIAAGWNHLVALKSDGTIWTWGDNYNGQLGDGTTTDRATPIQVSNLNLGTSVTPTPTDVTSPTPTATPPGTGVITGSVIYSDSGVPIPGAIVSTDTGGFTATTGSDGAYTIADVTAGDYTLTASATGFDSSSQAVTVTADSVVLADFALVSSETGTPIEASVSIKPKTINLRKKGKFKAFIELPSSYSVEDIDVDTVECNGALAISARVDVWDRFIAKFNIRDLDLDNYGSKKVQFTVSGELTDGTRFEGSDMVKIKFK